MHWIRTAFFLVMLYLTSAVPALAEDERVAFANDITVEDGSTSGDVVCMMCSVKIHGEVHGNVVTLFGSIMVDDARSISGDVVSVGGDVSVGHNASVQGDVVVVGGDLNRDAGATIDGKSDVLSGKGWLLLPIAPFLIFFGIVWLVVWLLTRRPYRFPMYPQGRGF